MLYYKLKHIDLRDVMDYFVEKTNDANLCVDSINLY